MNAYDPTIPHIDPRAYYGHKSFASQNRKIPNRTSKGYALLDRLVTQYDDPNRETIWKNFPIDDLRQLLILDPALVSAQEVVDLFIKVMPAFFASVDEWLPYVDEKELEKLGRESLTNVLFSDSENQVGQTYKAIKESGGEDYPIHQFYVSMTYHSVYAHFASAYLTTQLQDFAKSEVIPKYISRLDDMIAQGFPFPSERREDLEEVLNNIGIYSRPFAGGMSVGEGYFVDGYVDVPPRTAHEPLRPSDRETIDTDFVGIVFEIHILVHELTHGVSGATISPRIHKGEVIYEPTRVGLRTPSHEEISRALNEAYTEAFSRWIESDELPDFSNMTCAEFFTGPQDFTMDTYSREQIFFARVFGDMPIDTMTKAYFSDYRTINAPGHRADAHRDFMDAIERQVKGGLSGLEHLWELDGQMQSAQEMCDNLDRAILEPSQHSLAQSRQKLSDVCNTFDSELAELTDDWHKNLFDARSEGIDFRIKNGHTPKAHIEAIDPSFQSASFDDRGITSARQLYPARDL